MTEQETRNKINKTIFDVLHRKCVSDDCDKCVYKMNYGKKYCAIDRICDALIAAEIGDVTEWKDKATAAELVAQAAANAAIERIEGWKHRAKVAERAFDLINKENPSCFVPYSCRGIDCRECAKKYFYEQAEKELQEERKDD